MRRGISIGRLFGIPIVLDTSWFFIAVLVAAALASSFSQTSSGAAVWIAASLSSVGFFGSVIVHELSHSLVAIRRGIPVRQVRLFIFRWGFGTRTRSGQPAGRAGRHDRRDHCRRR